MKESLKILSIKSDKTELRKVEYFLTEIFIENKLPLQCFNKVLLCISEAVVNSIDHGNQNDQLKHVNIEIDFSKQKQMDIKISDEGSGFDYSTIKDPTCDDNIRKETGRGIHIIRALSDELEFGNKGNSVRFKLSVSE